MGGKPKVRRKLSSARWLERQARDPYVAAAKRAGYRSRAAYKLIGLDDRFRFLRRGGRIVDLGAAPGGAADRALAAAAALRGAVDQRREDLPPLREAIPNAARR